MSIAIDMVGIAGVALVVAAYFLITKRKLHGDDVRFHLLNFVGASLIMVSLMFHWNTASVVIEAIWMLISGWGIWRCWRIARRG